MNSKTAKAIHRACAAMKPAGRTRAIERGMKAMWYRTPRPKRWGLRKHLERAAMAAPGAAKMIIGRKVVQERQATKQ